MHITICLNSSESGVMKLPLAHLYLFQSLLYNLLPPECAAFLHDEGYRVDGRPMKLFAMSWPISDTRPMVRNGVIEYAMPVSLVVSTPVETTLDGLVGGAFRSGRLRVGNNAVMCESVEAERLTVSSDNMVVKTLSPITCYETMQRMDGRKYTAYFDPSSPSFQESLHVNLLRKFRALHPNRKIPDGRVEIKPLGEVRERTAKFNNESSFPIKGWEGVFSLSGPIELLQTGIDCGLGAKNSGGWGCVALPQ